VASVVVCINLKGGAGKSNLAVNVAWAGRGLLPVPVLKRPLEGAGSVESWVRAILSEAGDKIAVIDSPPSPRPPRSKI